MEKHPGIRAGSYWYTYEGHIYYRDTRAKNYYVCALRTTKERCLTRAKLENGRLVINKPHEHATPCPQDKITGMDIRNALKRKARTSHKSAGQIYREVERRYGNSVNTLMTAASAKMVVQHERNRHRPKLPADFKALETLLVDNELAENILKGGVTARDGDAALVFASDRMLHRLNAATELFVGATRKSIPFKPRAGQLLIFHVKFKGKAMAAAYALCETKTKRIYKAVWQFLKEAAPRLENNLKSVTMDHDLALVSATKKLLPRVAIHGCWFDYTMKIKSKWRELGLTSSNRRVLALAWGIPLLPVPKMSVAVKILKRANEREKSFYTKNRVRTFIEYIEDSWVTRGEEVSVYGVEDRTNNVCKAFHNRLRLHMGKPYPNLFEFLEKLSVLTEDIDTDWARLADAQNVTRIGKTKSKADNIEKQQHLLSERSITVGRFLLAVSPVRVFGRPNLCTGKKTS